MTREEIIETIRKNATAIKAEGVTKLALFGSRVRGDNRPDSDIDILIEVEPDTSFSILNLIGVQHIIEDATGLPCEDRDWDVFRAIKEKVSGAEQS